MSRRADPRTVSLHDDGERLRSVPVGRLFVSLAVPSIISQIVNLLYSAVDRMYVGHIPGSGTISLTALGVCVPVITLASSFALLVSSGAAPLTSIALGGGDKERAERILDNAFTAAAVMSLVLTAALPAFTEPVFSLFGASSATMPYARQYLRIYACGSVFALMTLGLNAFITAQVFSKTAMTTGLIGAATNIILAPLFIYYFKMGARGAAVATVIAQAASAAWALRFFVKRQGILELKLRHMRPRADVLLPALALGAAPFIMFSTESARVLSYNSSLLRYGGDAAVGMMTIMSTLMQFLMLPAQGLAQGAQPIISYNYGAGDAARVHEAFRRLIASAFAVTLAVYLLFMLAPEIVIRPFTSDPALISRTSWGMKIYFSAGILIGVQMASLQTLMALGMSGLSTFLSLLRKVFLLIPFIYIFPHFADDKIFAVIASEPAADVISVTTTIIAFTLQFKKILRGMKSPTHRCAAQGRTENDAV